MKMNKFIAIMLGLVTFASQGFFWQNRPTTAEDLEKRNIDLKYQEKQINVQQQKADAAAEARKKQENLNYKQSKIELQRKKDQLKSGL